MQSTTDSPSPPIIAEILAGDSLSLAEAARVVPAFRPGRPTHTATLWRWAAKGVRLNDGSVIKLETCRIGGRQMTSRAALGRFIRAQTPQADMAPGTAHEQSTGAYPSKSAARASAELDRLGIRVSRDAHAKVAHQSD
jgi:hypothetical protein